MMFAPKKKLKDRFKEWLWSEHGREVFRLFVNHAQKFKGKGIRQGAKAIVEHLRWNHNIDTQHGDFKIDNSFTSRMVREAEYRYPELRGYFKKKALKA